MCVHAPHILKCININAHASCEAHGLYFDTLAVQQYFFVLSQLSVEDNKRLINIVEC